MGDALRAGGARAAFLLALLVLSLVLNLGLYGGNLLRYRTPLPTADQVIGLDNALQGHVFARDYAIAGLRSGELSLEEAAAAAPRGDRGTLEILIRIRDPERMAEEQMSLGRYSWWWLSQMIQTSQGILAQRPMLKRGELFLGLHVLLLAVATAGFALGRWRGVLSPLSAWAAAIVLAYAVILFAAVHHPTYVRTGNPYLALQGRYLFPVAAPFYAVVATSLLHPLSQTPRWIAANLIGLFFIWGDLPYFLSRVYPPWLMAPS
jgi:hypothetical protein